MNAVLGREWSSLVGFLLIALRPGPLYFPLWVAA